MGVLDVWKNRKIGRVRRGFACDIVCAVGEFSNHIFFASAVLWNFIVVSFLYDETLDHKNIVFYVYYGSSEFLICLSEFI